MFCLLVFVAFLLVLREWNIGRRPLETRVPPIVAVILLAMCSPVWSQTSMELSKETREFYRNQADGCCVQMSLGIAGCHCNDPNASSLPFDSIYGPPERGGSWPSRVEAYCDKRGIKAWSVSGKSINDTLPWIEWAAKTGRFAAIGAGQAHFQTLYGYDQTRKRWYVCNNNSPQKIDEYTHEDFCKLHAASGPWVVILEKPSSPPPQFVQWAK